MATKKEPLNISFKINSIELTSQSISVSPDTVIDINDLNYNIGIQILYDITSGYIKISPTISICSKNDSSEYGKLSIDCFYEIIDFKEVIPLNENNSPIIPIPFLHTLISISLSTSRGIMYSSFRGTFLQKAILPIVDPTSFIQNPDNTAP